MAKKVRAINTEEKTGKGVTFDRLKLYDCGSYFEIKARGKHLPVYLNLVIQASFEPWTARYSSSSTNNDLGAYYEKLVTELDVLANNPYYGYRVELLPTLLKQTKAYIHPMKLF